MSTPPPNVDAAEVARFEKLAARWWDADGESRPLHDLNPLRTAFVAERQPLAGARVADVGCGGGLLSEALARAGATVVGIDLAPALIDVARLHLHESGLKVDYRLQSAHELGASDGGSFDAVCCMELVEHVPDPAALVRDLAALLKPGGKLFMSTVNRTPTAFAAAIVGSEYVLRLLPRGTHQYARFLRPSELGGMLRSAGLVLDEVRGMRYDPLRRKAWLAESTAVNYLVAAHRP
ncbi:MAG TPA: bifunctional 2-polyprenyl-6-hydroxyphenol methylase/3-demethylubiquinol 3-O-methyltransferase UbiG [Rhodanobacteraceae bacterium]|nr:bifunctional 2-polyprenyl-6-hydroxyphenol methylase/3-demethylubiquinol 3-O-methyltransferase UbiG [Rhodanobacteraceae bacterium]